MSPYESQRIWPPKAQRTRDYKALRLDGKYILDGEVKKKKILAGSVARETGARDRRLEQALGTALRRVVRRVALFFSPFFQPLTLFSLTFL
jgi:hypothetical protein